MDKFKAQIAPVAKHWFWIATGLVLIGSFGTWWMASGKLITEYQAASSKIETSATAVSGVQGKLSEHPNPKTHAEMQKLIEARKQAVLAAWSSIYERQQEILVWPVAELNEDFVREFRDLTPIEEKVPFPTPDDQEKETTLLNRYRYYIENVLPGIAEIAKTKWTAKFDQVGGGMESGGFVPNYSAGAEYPGIGPAVEGPLVKWETASQEALLTDLFPWRTAGQPKTLDVLYSQENLWILRQLMEIIANVNGDAGQRFQAKIHEINRISIGRSVSTTAGRISKPSTGISMMGGDMSGMESGSGMESMGMGSPGSDPSSSGMGMELAAIDPGDNRYVDTAGKPILASQLRAALASNSPTDAFMAVAKRIPVMMSFKMDQRAVPDLIAKCGSARLMVEVGQVRILPTGASAASASSAMSSGYESGGRDSSSMMDTSSDMSGMGGMSGSSMSSPGGLVQEQFPLDLDVEIYGIIYIYNPPLEKSLGIEEVTEDTVVEGTAMIDGSKVASAPSDAATVPVVAAPPETLPAPAVVASDAVAPDAAASNTVAPGAVAPAANAPAANAPAAVAPAAVAPSAATPLPQEPLPPVGEAIPPAAGAFWMPSNPSFRQFDSIV